MLRYTTLNLIIVLLYFGSIHAQFKFNVNLQTGNDSLLDGGNTVIELTNGNYLACGNLISIITNYSAAYIVKTDAHGDTLWTKQFDFAPNNGSDIFTDVKELSDKNYLLVGTTYDSIIQNSDVFLAKVDTNGTLLWFKKYTHNDNDQSAELEITPDNKIIILGNSTPNPSTTYNDVLLIKTDISGNLIWRKRFGNIYDEVYLSLSVIKNNTEYLLGGRYGYFSSGNPYFDMSIMRTDTAGNIMWQQQYGTPTGDEACGAAAYTLDSGFVMCGSYNSQAALMKLDKNGTQQWIKYFTLGTTTNDWLPSVKQLPDSSFVMIGSGEYGTTTAWTGFLLKADKNGNLIWKRHYDGLPTIPNYFYGFNTTSDGGFIITGQYNHIGQPYQNLWLVKTDSLGCDSVSCSFVTNVKNEMYESSDRFILFPNPNNGSFKIHFLQLKNPEDLLTVTIINLLGQTMYTNTLTASSNSDIEIKENKLSKGIYVITLLQSNKNIGQSKLIID